MKISDEERQRRIYRVIELVKEGMSAREIAKYLSENEAYLLTFNEDDGELLEYASGNEIIFNYEYSSGITICKYQESYFDEKKQETIIKDKKLTFVFMKEEMLYLRQKNLLFQKI